MNITQRIVKNTSTLAIAQAISYVLDFFFIMLIARYLGAEGFGILSFALAFTSIFIIFSDLGLQQLMIREIARNKSLTPKYLGNTAVIKAILAIVTFGLITLIINLLSYPQETITVVYLIGSSLVFNAFTLMFYSIFQAYERIEFMAVGLIIRAAILLGGAIFGINHEFSVVGLALLFPIASIFVLGYSFSVSLWKFVRPRIEIDFGFWKSTLKEAIPFSLSAIFVTIYFYIDTVMLSLMKGDLITGWYTASYRMVYLLLFIPGAYFASVYPIMSRYFLYSRESLRTMYQRSSRYMLILALPIGAGTSLLANRIILIVYGNEYISSVIALQVLIWAVFLCYMTLPLLHTLNSINKQIIYAGVTFLCMILNIILNLLLIPRLSYTGAGIATIATEFLGFALLFYYVTPIYGNPFSPKFIIKVVLATSIMAVYVVYFGDYMNIGLVIFTATIIYIALLLLIRVFSEEDIAMVKGLITRKSKQISSSTDHCDNIQSK